MKVITTEKAIEYLNKVLDDRGAFCKTHTNITEAIKIILAENENLKEGIKRQQKEIEYWKGEAISYQNMWGEAVSDLQAVKNETIKEFADSLFRKSQLLASSVYGTPERGVFLKDIDALVIEMKGKEV